MNLKKSKFAVCLTIFIGLVLAEYAFADSLTMTVKEVDRESKTVTVEIAYSLTSKETSEILLMGWRKTRRGGEEGMSLARKPVTKGTGTFIITAKYRQKDIFDAYQRKFDYNNKFTVEWSNSN
jgi:hypothetical protein